jgi:serine phosphatase RsbU (regulator of sigma subunit)
MTAFLKSPLKAILVLCVGSLIILCSYSGILHSYELITYDLRLRLRPLQETSKDIVLIEIADDTLRDLNQWPLPRNFHAALIDVLKKFKAKKIVFDILLSQTTPHDERLAVAIKNAGNVYLPEAFRIDESEDRNKNFLPPESPVLLSEPAKPLKEAAAGLGHINVFLGTDGKIRNIPLFIRYGNQWIPHLSLKVALSIDGFSVPVSKNASFVVNYPGLWKDTFEHLSYIDILKSYAALEKGEKPVLDLTRLENKVCFIGLTGTGTSDLRANPLESSYPMVGLQASVFNSLITGKFIRVAGPATNALISVIIFSISFIFCLRLLPLKAFIVNLVFAGFYGAIATSILIFGGLWIGLFLPMLVIALTLGGTFFYRFLLEIKNRALMERELEIAAAIQKSFLPAENEDFAKMGVAAFLEPATLIAGDLYDIVRLDENGRIGILIGDVCGKGIATSLNMAQTVSLFRVFAIRLNSPAAVLGAINKELCRILQGRFVTAIFLIADKNNGSIRVSCAGHLPLICHERSTGKSFEFPEISGPALGLENSSVYQDFQKSFQKGDKILFYTDGVTEARTASGEEFGVERIKTLLEGNKDLSPKEIIGKLKKEILRFQEGSAQSDDITAVILEF